MIFLDRIMALHLLGQAKGPEPLDDGTAVLFVNNGLANPHVYPAPEPTLYTITEKGRAVLAAANADLFFREKENKGVRKLRARDKMLLTDADMERIKKAAKKAKAKRRTA